MPEGCDISEHQGNLPADWFDQWDYCIIRAFNENGYPDIKFAQNWDRARGHTLRGVYGWPIAGAGFARNHTAGAQLVATAPDAEAGYWADVEHSGRGLASADETEAYLRGIGGRCRGFYSNVGELPRSPFLDAEQWWVANYSVNDGTRHPVNTPRPWVIHQYTSNPLDKNFSPNLDWLGADMPLTLTDFEGIQKAVSGSKNLDDSYPTIAQVVRDLIDARKEIAALSAKVDALAATSATQGPNVALLPSDLDAIATKVAEALMNVEFVARPKD
jgi:hypothetical protein